METLSPDSAPGSRRWCIPLLLLALLLAVPDPHAPAQTDAPDAPSPSAEPAAPTQESRPLPDIPNLMHQVENNQRSAESIEKSYIYHSVETQRERDKFNVIEADHFWINGVPVRRILKKNGKELSPDELAKQDRRMEKEAKEARERRDKMEATGKESDPEGHEEITVSRLLELGAFSNPRRVSLNGRDTIAVDYTGDPHAKTRNRAEDVIRDMAGTAWVDEQDKVLVRAEGRFVRPFKIGAGLLVDIKQDTQFTFQQRKVNDEVWLPSRIDAQGAARAMLFFAFAGTIEVTYSDYRKFRTSTTILPASSPVSSVPEP